MTIIVLIVLGVLVVWAIFMYNRFVALIERAKEAWADIDVQMKRRYDLIPNLIETVKGYAKHERETLDAVVEARTQATSVHIDPSKATPEAVEIMTQAEGVLSQSLGKLLAIAEAYPDLKANTNFLELQRELTDTEDKIQAARRFYNGNVRDLKIAIKSFPSNIIATLFNFSAEQYVELGETERAAREPVKVSF